MSKKGFIKKLCLVLSLLLTLVSLVSCSGKKLTLLSNIKDLKVGDTVQLKIAYKDEELPVTDFIYASENPDVASISESGKVTASKQGKTKIYVQLKENKKAKLEFNISVYYEVQDAVKMEYDKTVNAINSYDLFPFWERNGYCERIGNWKILDIVNIVMKKGEGEYVFTDLYKVAEVKNDNFIIITDWTNDDISFNDSILDSQDLSDFIAKRISVNKSTIAQYGVNNALQTIKADISKKLKIFQGNVYLSELPDDYQYRVCVKIDYSVYKAENFLSKGVIKGGASVILDLIKLDITSFLSSYTYSEDSYELILEGYSLVIERQEK